MARSQRREWTLAEDERLASAYREGVLLAEIAQQLGCDVHHVVSRIEALRREGAQVPLRRPRWDHAQRLLLASGYSLRELQQEFGRGRGTITSQLRTLRRLGYDLGDDQGAIERTGRY